jgi:hypothetical protein
MNEKQTIEKVILVLQTLYASEKIPEGVSFIDGYAQALADAVKFLEEFKELPEDA